MDERTTQRDQLASRLRDIEAELKALRASVDGTHNTVDAIHRGLSQLQEQLLLTAQVKKQHKPKVLASIQAWMEKTASGWYVAGARVLLRTDASQLFDRGYYLSRIYGLNETKLDPVYHYLHSGGAVSPHWLFDRDYYLRMYPDVARAKVDPLIHFLRSGWQEGRNPHPLFNTSFYLEQAPALKTGNLNPVAHYVETGWRKGLLPHPLFDGNYYLAIHPDIAASAMDPLTHYVLFGAQEGRQPHQWFDSPFYRVRNPDVAQARIEPIQHYIEHGAQEGRDPHPLFDTLFYQEEYGSLLGGLSPLEHFVLKGRKENRRTIQTDVVERYLPVVSYTPPKPRGQIVDIIVPVYRGLAETRSCIESVLAATNQEPFELIVINDVSPEPALTAWLKDASSKGQFTLLENQTNLGFVATVNRGMSLHPDRDVLLLNSDTTVANDWLDRLVRTAYQSDRIGSVTPLSNNATICSYPRFCEDNSLPADTTAAELDRLAAEVNQGRFVDIPTAVGFCMYIRRECLDQIGLFDVEAFGKGYGEENDFSLRAAAGGWRNVLAADIFVFHAGSVSFAKGAASLRDKGVQVIAERYPKYLAQVSRHVSRDAAQPYRFSLTAARFRHSPHPTILLVTHDLGGGIRQHIEELVQSLRGQANFLELQPGSGSTVLLRSGDAADGLSLTLDLARQYDTLLSLLRSFHISRMHIHHVLRHSVSLEKLRHDLDVPMEFTVHDYLAICPRFVLADPEGKYCGEPDERGCNTCIRTTLPHLNLDIGSWRAKYAWLLNSADRVIAPSADAATRMSRYFPAAHIQAAVHPLQPAPGTFAPVQPAALRPGDKLRVAALGVMSWHKGLRNLERCAQIAKERGLPLEFVLVGYCEPQVRSQGPFTFTETGEYARPELAGVLEATAPGLIWFPQRWPETFSYTLSVCLEYGYPVAAPRLGALPERLSSRNWTWVYDWAIEPEALIDLFLRAREAMVQGAAPHPAPARVQADPAFYPAKYLVNPSRTQRALSAPAVDHREPGRFSVIALLSSYDSGQMQSCGYIRAYLPLMHDKIESLIRLTVTTPESALTMAADVLLVQRTTIPTLALAEELVAHCERHGIRIVYETDDDLFNIHEGHADSSFYTPLLRPAELMARQAAMVLVSSPVLKERLAHLNPDIRVIPNALDESLWFPTGPRKAKRQFRPAGQPVRILYMGTMTHGKDLEILEEPMRRLKAEFGSGIELDLIGIMPDHRKRDWFNTIPVPAIYGHSYPLFAEWIRKENKWDFALAPLVDDEFNRCKSYIKYLDYAALGLAGIFSGIGVFEPVVVQGETGLCVPDTASWYEAIRLLVADAPLRGKMGEAAYLDVETNHTLAAQHALRRDLWTQIGNLPAVRSSSTMVSFSEETTATSSKGI
jgi:GT2 family glycosyltransferase/glycosyltransferase involved in cell wall biosynthesis